MLDVAAEVGAGSARLPEAHRLATLALRVGDCPGTSFRRGLAPRPRPSED
jgi:hypothetical protein